MAASRYVIGFVPIYPEAGAYRHLTGRTLRMRWPGSAENWLDGLVESGHFRAWTNTDPAIGEPAEYRGARVFRCQRAIHDGQSTTTDAELVAVWESSC